MFSCGSVIVLKTNLWYHSVPNSVNICFLAFLKNGNTFNFTLKTKKTISIDRFVWLDWNEGQILPNSAT